MFKSFKGILLVALVSLLLVAAGCGNSNVVATVNGEEISKQQLDDTVQSMKDYYKSMGLAVDEKDEEMMKMVNSTALDQLITQTLMLQEAEKLGIKVEKADVDKEIDNYKKSMGEDKFKQTLAANGWSEPEFRDMVEKDLLVSALQKKVTEGVKPATEADARAYYEKNPKEFVEPASYEVRHILVLTQGKEGDKSKIDLEARTKAQAILAQLKQGKDFAALAKEKSEDTGTAAEGGLFVFSPGEAVAEFEEAAKALKPGEITQQPVKTEYGYHIIRMEKYTPEKQKSFAEVNESLIARLTDEAGQKKFSSFLDEARKKAKIVNYLEKPGEQKAAEPKDQKAAEKK